MKNQLCILSFILYYITLYYIILYHVILYYIISYYIILYYIILYYFILYVMLCYVMFFCQCPGEIEANGTSIHSWKGFFCIKKGIRNKTVPIHTGGVDAMWRLSKSAIPCSLPTRADSQVNPKLMRSIRVWQWRWMNSKAKNFLEITGRSLQKRMAMWKEENIARVWRSKFPVNCRSWSKNQWKFAGILVTFSSIRSIVSPWQKQHFFKTLTSAGAVFSRRVVYGTPGCPH